MATNKELVYEAIRQTGTTPEEVFRASRTERSAVHALVVLRNVFRLSLPEAKGVMSRAGDAELSLSEREEALRPLVARAIALITE